MNEQKGAKYGRASIFENDKSTVWIEYTVIKMLFLSYHSACSERTAVFTR